MVVPAEVARTARQQPVALEVPALSSRSPANLSTTVVAEVVVIRILGTTDSLRASEESAAEETVVSTPSAAMASRDLVEVAVAVVGAPPRRESPRSIPVVEVVMVS